MSKPASRAGCPRQAAYNRAYYLAHREEISRKRAERYQATKGERKAADIKPEVDRVKRRAYMRRWRAENAEACKAKAREYYARNRESITAKIRDRKRLIKAGVVTPSERA